MVGGPLLLLGLFLTPAMSAQELPLELLWEVGSVEGLEGGDWITITSAAVVGDRIFVADARAPQIKLFDLDGNYLKQVGGLGGGPGEYTTPIGLTTVSGQVLMGDLWASRRVVYSQSGAHLRTDAIATATERPLTLRWSLPLPNGWWVGRAGILTRGEDEGDTKSALYAWKEGQVPTQLETFNDLIAMAIWFLNGNRQPYKRSTGARAGPTGDAVPMGPDRVVVLDGEAAELRLLAASSSPDTALVELERWRLPELGRPTTEVDRRAMIEESRRQMGPMVTFDEWSFPDHYPAFVRLLAADESTVWLQQGPPHRPGEVPGTQVWHRFSLDSGLGGSIVLPRGVEIVAFGPRIALTRRTGEFDELYLQAWRIGGG